LLRFLESVCFHFFPGNIGRTPMERKPMLYFRRRMACFGENGGTPSCSKCPNAMLISVCESLECFPSVEISTVFFQSITQDMFPFICFFLFFFFCSTGVWTHGLHLEPLHQPFFVMCIWDRVSWTILSGLALNYDTPDLCLLSS
jgi:hypothetical protein